MRSVTVIIPFTIAARAFTNDVLTKRDKLVDRAHDSMYKAVDKLVDKFLDRASKSLVLQHADLDEITLRKPGGHLTKPACRSLIASQGQTVGRVSSLRTGCAQLPSMSSATPAAPTNLGSWNRFSGMPSRGDLVIPRVKKGSDLLPANMGGGFGNPGEYPDPDFIAAVRERFPKEAIGDVFDARVLIEEGYKWLDVRTPFEFGEGHVTNAVNIPLILGNFRFDSEANDRIVKNQKPNVDFIKMVEKKFPDKSAKLLVACSDDRQRSRMALEELDEAGYTNVVGVKGGFLHWQRVYDNKYRRRRNSNTGYYERVGYGGGDGYEGVDSFHGSGGLGQYKDDRGNTVYKSYGNYRTHEGLPVVDRLDKTPLRDYQDWIEYYDEMQKLKKGGSVPVQASSSPSPPVPVQASSPSPSPSSSSGAW